MYHVMVFEGKCDCSIKVLALESAVLPHPGSVGAQ